MKKRIDDVEQCKLCRHKKVSWVKKMSMILAIFMVSSAMFGQRIMMSLKLEETSISKVLQEIKAKSNLSIVYNSSDIDEQKKVSIDVENEDLDVIMGKVLEGTDLTYTIRDNHLVLSKKRAQETKDEPKKDKTAVPVSGVILDEFGDPLIGVSVVEKGTTNGSITDVDGKFKLSIQPNGLLLVSYMGYQKQEIKVGQRTTFSISLKEDSKMLDEIVVVGYGTMEKRAVTSSVSSIKGSSLAQGIGGSTIATALQGKVSGLTISGTSSPNSSNSLQLRGVASINASKGPLVVIDGVPGGDLRSLQQEDIESIDVLKDASAGAIYGTRATGGVILVTTKQGTVNGNVIKLRDFILHLFDF